MDDLTEIAAVIAISVVLCVICCATAANLGYQQGQIDAANGQQHYHLVTQPDGSTEWERKDDKP